MKLTILLAAITTTLIQADPIRITHTDGTQKDLTADMGKCTGLSGVPVQSIKYDGGGVFVIFYSDNRCKDNIGGGPGDQNFNPPKEAKAYRLINLRGYTPDSFYSSTQYYNPQNYMNSQNYYYHGGNDYESGKRFSSSFEYPSGQQSNQNDYNLRIPRYPGSGFNQEIGSSNSYNY